MKITIERSANGIDGEVDITVEYEAHAAHRGYHEKGGGQIDPDEPAWIEIDSVVETDTGIGLELTEKQLDELEERIGNHLYEIEAAAESAAYDIDPYED